MDETLHHSSPSDDCRDGDDQRDIDCRAVVFRPWHLRTSPVRAFHASWMSFCMAMFSSFAPAALTVPIRDALDLNERDVALGGALTLAATAVCRILLGSLCQRNGPKIIATSTLLLTALPLFFLSVINRPLGHTICRPLIGLSMGCQTVSLFWCSRMFVDDIVGAANSTTLGLSEAGFGLSQLLMPLLFTLLSKIYEPFVAWRLALLVPGLVQVVICIYIIAVTQDRPDGAPPRKRTKKISHTVRELAAAVSNYRTWVFAIVYGVVTGSGLAIYNIITAYYFDNYDISFAVAGFLGSLAGLDNLPFMPVGGYLSDFIAVFHGMRGRLSFGFVTMISLAISLVFLSKAHGNLTLSIVAMQLVLAFIATFAAALFSVTPFVSHRALGIVQGIVGSGANVIGAILQELLFNKTRMETQEAFFWAGILIGISSLLLLTVYYPAWGGILFKAIPGAQESTYYLSEYTQEEIQMGLANKSIQFAQKTTSERCST